MDGIVDADVDEQADQTSIMLTAKTKQKLMSSHYVLYRPEALNTN
jgi:hypothetical protein